MSLAPAIAGAAAVASATPAPDALLLAFALATACIEVPVWFVCGHRRPGECLWFFLINIMSNMLLNEWLAILQERHFTLGLAAGELTVIALESLLFLACYPKNRPAGIFSLAALTNGVSFISGCLWFSVGS